MKSELYINNFKIDLSDDVPIPISYSIADIKEPQNRKRNFTKSIKLPGTANNKAFFSSAYMLSLSAVENTSVGFDFDPTKQLPAVLMEDGVAIFIGMARLLDVTIEDKDYAFNITLLTNLVELFSSLKDVKLSELGWSEYDHTLSVTNIQNSWDTSVVKNGTPTANFTAGVPDGFGYLYPIADYGYSANLREYLTNNIFPHVYLREFMVKCFESVGQTITGSFIDSEILKRLVIGFGGGEKQKLNPAEVLARKSQLTASGTFDEDFTYSNVIPQINGYYVYWYNYSKSLKLTSDFGFAATVITDSYSQFDDTTGDFTIAKQGRYSLIFTGDVNFEFDINSVVQARVLKNGAIVGTLNYTNVYGVSMFDGSLDLNLNPGDIVSLQFALGVNQSIINTTAPENVTNKNILFEDDGGWTVELRSIGGNPVDGDDIFIANYLPDIKCVDLLNSIIMAFNLYVDDPDIDGNVNIEPLDDFYQGSNTADDFTHLLDHSKKQQILSSSQIKGKNYLFKFAEDNDYWNKKYREIYGAGYGDKNYQVQSTFEKGERIYQLAWANTVPVEVPGTNIVIPTIINYDENTLAVSPYKGKARVYIYSGLRASSTWKLINSATLTPFAYTSYPCCNHLDDVDNPAFDLNFDIPPVLQWTNANYTLTNLFSEYHEKFIREITGKDSKILRAYFKLNKDHVKSESFRRLVKINGVLFRKNEITDYNGNGEETTFVELVRIIDGSRRRIIPIIVPTDVSNIDIERGGTDGEGTSTNPLLYTGERDSVDKIASVERG